MGEVGARSSGRTQPEPTVESSRTYRGELVSERRAGRRRGFIDAAIEVFGTTGYASSSVAMLCREACLSRRQFYDEFSDREELLVTVYREIHAEARALVKQALKKPGATPADATAAAVTAFMESVAVDRRRAQILFNAAVGAGEAVEMHRIAERDYWIDCFLEVMRLHRPAATAAAGRARQQIQAVGFLGALTSIAYRWSFEGPRRLSLDDIIDILAESLRAFAIGTEVP